MTQHPTLALQALRNFLSFMRQAPAYSRHCLLQSLARSGQVCANVAQGHGPSGL